MATSAGAAASPTCERPGAARSPAASPQQVLQQPAPHSPKKKRSLSWCLRTPSHVLEPSCSRGTGDALGEGRKRAAGEGSASHPARLGPSQRLAPAPGPDGLQTWPGLLARKLLACFFFLSKSRCRSACLRVLAGSSKAGRKRPLRRSTPKPGGPRCFLALGTWPREAAAAWRAAKGINSAVLGRVVSHVRWDSCAHLPAPARAARPRRWAQLPRHPGGCSGLSQRLLIPPWRPKLPSAPLRVLHRARGSRAGAPSGHP